MALPFWKNWYNRVFRKHLFVTNTVSCCTLMGFGDWIQQRFHNNFDSTPNNWKRTARMATMGLALGPMAHFWYRFLDRLYKVNTGKVVFKKILWDQLVAAPVFSFTFLPGMCLLEGKDWSGAMKEFIHKFPTVYVVSWCLWPAVQTLNFFLVPPQFRVIYISCIDMVWFPFNSYIKHKEDIGIPFIGSRREKIDEETSTSGDAGLSHFDLYTHPEAISH